MPADRPQRAQCYFNRDRQYFQDLERMLSGLVVQPPDHLLASISLDQIATIVASSRKVRVEQLQVAIISKDKFIVILPPNQSRDDVVATIPKSVWDQGYKLHSYSPLLDTAISIPMFKLWIDIEGVPLGLSHESHMAKAIASFGCYLGSLEPRTHGDCRNWSVFLATDDLALIPHQLEFRIGGIVYTATIRPRKWTQGQVYQRSDLPPSPIAYQPAPSCFSNPQLALRKPSVPDPIWFQGEDVMHMSLKAMRQIFRDFDPSELPPDLAECLAGNPAAIKAHNDAGRAWEQQVVSKGKAKVATDTPPMLQRGCVMCDRQHPECAMHLFFSCPYATIVWSAMAGFTGFNVMTTADSIRSTYTCSIPSDKDQRRSWTTLFVTALWHLWRERNSRTFRHTATFASLLANRIWDDVGLYLRHCTQGRSP